MSEFTVSSLERKEPAGAGSLGWVSVGGDLLATWGHPGSLTAACPGWEAPGPDPAARHKW